MTLDEAINHCYEVAEDCSGTDCAGQHEQLARWLKELKGYREGKGNIRRQDAISRQAVDEAIYDYSRSCDVNYAQIMEYIDKIPSVKPQEQKTGHWVGIDEEPHEVWECDHCGFVIDGSGCIDPYDYRDTYKFCPNCGCRMVEPQESEVSDADSN